MNKSLPSYEPGDRVRVSHLIGFPQYTNVLGVVATVRGTYSGTNSNGRVEMVKNAYKVMFMDNMVGIVSPDQLSPAEPYGRHDLDKLVAWASLPDQVVLAMQLGPREDV